MTRKRTMFTLRHAVCAIAGPISVHIYDDAAVAIKVQLTVCCGFEMLEDSLCCGHMAGEWTGIVSAESSNCK